MLRGVVTFIHTLCVCIYIYLQIQYMPVMLHEMLKTYEVKLNHIGMVLKYCFWLVSQDNLKSYILNTVSLFS